MQVNGSYYKAIFNNSDNSFTITQAVKPPTPAVEIESKTASSITVMPLENQATYGTAEYSIDNANWQTSNVIENLSAGKSYAVYARYKGNETYVQSDTGELESVSTKAASYTITIPAVTLEAGNGGSKANIEVNSTKTFDLGYNGHVDVKINNNNNTVTEDAKLKLTRQNDTGSHTITSALLVKGKALGNINNSVATFRTKNDTPVPISFDSPTPVGGKIPAGEYSATITFEVSYSEQ